MTFTFIKICTQVYLTLTPMKLIIIHCLLVTMGIRILELHSYAATIILNSGLTIK